MVLFAPRFAIVFGSHFEEFEASVARQLTALFSHLFQFDSREWLEIRGDSKGSGRELSPARRVLELQGSRLRGSADQCHGRRMEQLA
jgi:hypothetical protein